MITPELVKKALSLIKKRSVDYELFFNNLKSPDWIAPLRQQKMFIDPPPILKEGNPIRFPIWPESQYLSRMAKLDPKAVLDVMLKIPETDNIRVHEDLIDAALEMPVHLAAKWTKGEIAWINRQTNLYLLLPDKLGRLMVYLAKGSQTKIALELAKSLLDVLPHPDLLKKTHKQNLVSSVEATGRFDSWEYEEIFKKYVPQLIKFSGVKMFIVICDLLEKSLGFSRRNKKGTKGSEDYSSVWREFIEDGEENHSRGIDNILVSALRDSGKTLMEEKLLTVGEIVEVTKGSDLPLLVEPPVV